MSKNKVGALAKIFKEEIEDLRIQYILRNIHGKIQIVCVFILCINTLPRSSMQQDKLTYLKSNIK
jgi:hypothetical protein